MIIFGIFYIIWKWCLIKEKIIWGYIIRNEYLICSYWFGFRKLFRFLESRLLMSILKDEIEVL